jgi:hypothetical protein
MKALEWLAEACQELRKRINAEVREPRKADACSDQRPGMP